MGLDMYLTAKKDFYPDFGDDKEKNRKAFSKLLSGAGITVNEIDSEFPTADVSFKVGYWRKANAIHAWFVKHCQAGVDDCNSHSVSRENLIKLKMFARLCLPTTAKQTVYFLHKQDFSLVAQKLQSGILTTSNLPSRLLTVVLKND